MEFQGGLCVKQLYRYLKNKDMLNFLHHGQEYSTRSKNPYQTNFKFLVTREKTYLYKMKYL